MQPSYFFPFAVTTVLATCASIILAVGEEATGTFLTVAEKYGLFAAMTVGLVVMLCLLLYRQMNFNQTTLVKLIEATHTVMMGTKDAVRGCPCGDDWDSDGEETPGGTKKAIERVARRERRQRERHPESQPK